MNALKSYPRPTRPAGITLIGIFSLIGGASPILLLVLLGNNFGLYPSSFWLFIIGPALIAIAVGLGFFRGVAWAWWLYGFGSVGLLVAFISISTLFFTFGRPESFFGIPVGTESFTITDFIESFGALFITVFIYLYLLSTVARRWFGLLELKPAVAVKTHFGTGLLIGILLYFSNRLY